MIPYIPDWLRNEILDGLSKLMTLSLDRQPARDVIAGTAGTWLEALTHNRQWSQTDDTPRIRQAFRSLSATCNTWPTPKIFMEHLPSRVKASESVAGHIESPEAQREREESRARVGEMLDQFARKMGIGS